MTIPADRLAAFIFETYVLPVRGRDEKMVMIPVRQVWKELKGEFPLGFIRGVLGSMTFRNTYGLALVAAEGSPEQAQDTYVFKLLGDLRLTA